MARFKADEAEHYGGQGGAGYFSLKNDKDTAQVRFMYNSVDDITGYAVHEVEIDGKKRYVNCPREYNQPLDVCPFCAKKKFTTVKLFIPIYNIDQDRVQIWERGKKFIGRISSLCARYPNTVSQIFEIERNGQKSDTQTSYEFYPIEKDDTTLDDLPEVPDPLGTIVLDKSTDDMEFYLENGYFPPDDEPVRRRPVEDEPTRESRRTPASRRRETF